MYYIVIHVVYIFCLMKYLACLFEEKKFCTHLSNQYVGVATIEGTRPLEVVTLDLEIAYLLCCGIPSQKDIQLCLQLENGCSLHCE